MTKPTEEQTQRVFEKNNLKNGKLHIKIGKKTYAVDSVGGENLYTPTRSSLEEALFKALFSEGKDQHGTHRCIYLEEYRCRVKIIEKNYIIENDVSEFPCPDQCEKRYTIEKKSERDSSLWSRSSWFELNQDLKKYFESLKELERKNNPVGLDWNFD